MTEDNARQQNKKGHLDIGEVIWSQHNGLRLLNQLQITWKRVNVSLSNTYRTDTTHNISEIQDTGVAISTFEPFLIQFRHLGLAPPLLVTLKNNGNTFSESEAIKDKSVQTC